MVRDSDDIVSNMEFVIGAARSGRTFDGEMQSATAAIINWLAARVPYKETLPRGYSILCQVQTDANGVARRYHRLLKAASSGLNGQGVWIDTATLDQTDIRDVRVFADDLASGLLSEIIGFLQQYSPAN